MDDVTGADFGAPSSVDVPKTDDADEIRAARHDAWGAEGEDVTHERTRPVWDGTVSSYPSPAVSRQCDASSGGTVHAYICDPDGILSTGPRQRLAESLWEVDLRLRNSVCTDPDNEVPRVALAAVHEPPHGATLHGFAESLLDSWGSSKSTEGRCSSDAFCAVLVFDASKSQIELAWRPNMEPLLNARVRHALSRSFNKYVHKLPSDESLARTINTFGLHLAGEIPPPRTRAQLIALLTIMASTFLLYSTCATALILDYLGGLRPRPVSRAYTSLEEEKPPDPTPRHSMQRRHSSIARENSHLRNKNAKKLLAQIQQTTSSGFVNLDICPLTLKSLRRAGIEFVYQTKAGYRYDRSALRQLGPLGSADPLLDARAAGPLEAVKLFLQTLQQLYPELISDDDVVRWLRDTVVPWKLSERP
eukprot:Polyplicarium_translucidae@DN1130_c0_g2_i1.p1